MKKSALVMNAVMLLLPITGCKRYFNNNLPMKTTEIKVEFFDCIGVEYNSGPNTDIICQARYVNDLNIDTSKYKFYDKFTHERVNKVIAGDILMSIIKIKTILKSIIYL